MGREEGGRLCESLGDPLLEPKDSRRSAAAPLLCAPPAAREVPGVLRPAVGCDSMAKKEKVSLTG